MKNGQKKRVFLAFVLFAWVSGDAAADYLKHYWDGREAYRNRKYRESVVFLVKAIEQQPAPGERVRWRGTHFEAYLPHFHLGRALYELRRYEQTIQAWKEAVRQGAILQRSNRRENRELERTLEEIHSRRFPDVLEQMRREVTSTTEQIQALRGIGGLVVEENSLEEAETLLAGAVEELSAAEAGGEFAPLGQASEDVHDARVRLLQALDAAGERERRVREEQERQAVARAREAYERTERMLAAGSCVPETVKTLQGVLTEGGMQARTRSAPVPVPLLLSRAYTQCGDLLMAAQYLELARRSEASGVEQLEEQQRLLSAARAGRPGGGLLHRDAEGRSAVETMTEYLAVRARIDLLGCDPGAIGAMQAARSLETPSPAGLSLDPELDLARARSACGDRNLGIYSESHALVVGVASYDAGEWGQLPEVLQDTNEIEALLRSHGFAVEKLIDPDSATLRESMQKFFARKRNPDTRLVFYYGGHGHTEVNRYLRLGYIVPADTPFPENDPEDSYLGYLVSMDGFEGFARETKANHAMFLFDSCFSGTVFDSTKTRFRMSRRNTHAPDEALARPVRLFVTAGDETQQVPAESEFRTAVVRALEGFADADTDGLILGAEVGQYVAVNGSSPRNTPQWGVLEGPGFDDGDLAFESSGLAADRDVERIALDTEIALWHAARSFDDADSLRRYLARYPDGHFVPLAKWMLDREPAE